MSQKAKNIFIKDGAGFIGSNLEDLLTQHHNIVIIDNLATRRWVNIERFLDSFRMIITFSVRTLRSGAFSLARNMR